MKDNEFRILAKEELAKVIKEKLKTDENLYIYFYFNTNNATLDWLISPNWYEDQEKVVAYISMTSGFFSKYDSEEDIMRRLKDIEETKYGNGLLLEWRYHNSFYKMSEKMTLFFMDKLNENPLFLKHIKNPTREMCLLALEKDRNSLKYVPSSFLNDKEIKEKVKMLLEDNGEKNDYL